MQPEGFPDRAAITAVQAARLRQMVSALVPANSFYRGRLARFARASADRDLSDEALLAEFRALVPFTRKQDLVEDQRAHPPFGTNLTDPLERYFRYSETSGTISAPLRWLDTPESWSWMVDNWVRVLQASGVAPPDRIFFAFSFGPFLGFWTAFEAGTRLGCMCLPGGGLSSAARLRTLLDAQATVLCCTPTYAVRLGEVAATEGIDLSAGHIRAILVAGEPGAGIPAVRTRIERLWPGARVHDHHGMTEVGPVSFECPARESALHVMEASFIPEVINPATLKPAGPGEQGELVLTNLGRTASPLLRYRTGDLVRAAPEAPCACGRCELALEFGILGRTDDMVLVRGVNLYPSAFEAVVRRFSEITEYCVEVDRGTALAEVRLILEPAADCLDPAVLASRVQSALRAAFNLRIPVALAPPDSLPRFEMKAKRWVAAPAQATVARSAAGIMEREMNDKQRVEAEREYHLPFDIREIGRRGEELYERELRDRLEPEHVGKFIVMNVETGEYELDADKMAAGQRAMARFPAHTRYMKRVGYDVADSIGGPMRRTAR